MNEEFKVNIFFEQDGEDVEKLLANYLIRVINEKNGVLYVK